MRWMVFVAALAVCGCSSGVRDAEDRLAMAQKAGNQDEICKRSQEVADAYLAAKDQAGYEEAAAVARLRCAS